jgi:hypothetical protein
MARIRSIKPEVRISEKVNSWPIPVRYFWVLLWGYCDDYGYGRDNPRLIVADSFPLDDSVTAEMVAEWMDRIWADGVIERFAVDDARYFRVVNWDEHQKISHPAKKVLPDIEDATEVFQRGSESLRRITEALENPSPKQGAGSREQKSREPRKPSEKAPRASGTRISEDFSLTDEMRAWGAENAPLVNLDRALPSFVDYWAGVAGQKGVKQNWVATWRNSMRKQQEWAERDAKPTPIAPRDTAPVKHAHKWLADGSCMLCTARRDREDTW